MMKKLISVLLAILLLSTLCYAETVYVTISDGEGKLAVPHTAIEVSDTDADGAITISDALYAAHEAGYPGGAEAGYAVSMGEFGLCINKLWGEENGGSYGYYVNNASAFNLADPVKDGDSVQAYAFSDLVGFSDTFSFFDLAEIETDADFQLTLNCQMYDADWNPVYMPVEGAEITLNGEGSGIYTDAEGKALLDLEPGEYLVSARSETITLVPPVCNATVK